MEPPQPVTLPNSRALCAALDKYRLPRAMLHVETRSFVAWNKPFLTLTGFSGHELASLNAQDWVVLGDPIAEAPGLISCLIRTADSEKFITGHAALGDDGSVYVMPDPENWTSDAYEWGRMAGSQEERAKIKQVYHEAVSPELIAALATLGEAERQLKATHPRQAAELTKVARLIDKVIEKLAKSLED
jgi:hypothetical protein